MFQPYALPLHCSGTEEECIQVHTVGWRAPLPEDASCFEMRLQKLRITQSFELGYQQDSVNCFGLLLWQQSDFTILKS